MLLCVLGRRRVAMGGHTRKQQRRRGAGSETVKRARRVWGGQSAVVIDGREERRRRRRRRQQQRSEMAKEPERRVMMKCEGLVVRSPAGQAAARDFDLARRWYWSSARSLNSTLRRSGHQRVRRRWAEDRQADRQASGQARQWQRQQKQQDAKGTVGRDGNR